jgi:hypothetical protein
MLNQSVIDRYGRQIRGDSPSDNLACVVALISPLGHPTILFPKLSPKVLGYQQPTILNSDLDCHQNRSYFPDFEMALIAVATSYRSRQQVSRIVTDQAQGRD